MRPCHYCGTELRGKQRQFCSQRCVGKSKAAEALATKNARARAAAEARFEELQDLLQAGESPWQIPARLGTTPGALARWLYRNGHRELARPFEHIRKVAA